MKTLQKIALSIGLMGLFYSCQSTNQVLSKSEKRVEIMNTIANDESMSKEMMQILMNSTAGKMMQQEKEMKMKEEIKAKMMEKMKEDPEMMKKMMEKMKENPEMMEMMEKMKKDKMEMKKMEEQPAKKEEHKAQH